MLLQKLKSNEKDTPLYLLKMLINRVDIRVFAINQAALFNGLWVPEHRVLLRTLVNTVLLGVVHRLNLFLEITL